MSFFSTDLRKFQLTVITSIVASVCAMVFTVALMTVCIVMIKLLKPQNIGITIIVGVL